MRRAIFRASVRADLLEIYDWIAESTGGISAANRFVQRLQDHCHHLAGLPGLLGRQRPELRDDLRSVAVGNYVIFFQYVGDRFEVVNILHGRRDIDELFREEG